MMVDFFTRLAERTMGLATGVRPDYPPVLAPAADGETFEDGAVAPASLRLESAGSIAATVPERKAQRTTITQRAFDQPIRRSTLALDAQDQSSQSQLTVVAAPTTAQGQARDASTDSQALRPEYSETPLPIDSNDEGVPPAHRESLAVAGPLPTVAAPQWRPVAPQAPTVQVTIGRVEIRAVTPPPTAVPQRAAERRGAARLSLEEYLRQRNEGRR